MEKCYLGMAGGGTDINDWNDCFDVLIQIIENERESNPDFGRELDLLDDETDYRHDVQGWIEDYLDENDVIFTVALQLYKANGNKTMEKKMDDALEEYDKALERYLTGLDDEELEFGDIDWEMDEDDLPFN